MEGANMDGTGKWGGYLGNDLQNNVMKTEMSKPDDSRASFPQSVNIEEEEDNVDGYSSDF
jgi:hypothetical protein